MKAGDCPDWFTDFAVADRLHITPMEARKMPLLWYNRALCVLNAEAEAREYHNRE
jgi:hypothetical protein